MEVTSSTQLTTGSIYPEKPSTVSSRQKTELSDIKNINPLTSLLSNSGINFNESFSSFIKNELNFNLNFLTEKTETLTANGFYSEESRSLSVSFQYEFERLEERDGKMYRKKYKLDFGFNLNEVKKESITGSIKKEDLLDYIKRVVKRIFEVADDEEVSVGKVMFEDEDVAEILGLEDKKILDGIINLINTAIVVARLKEMINDKKDAKVIDFGVEREKILEIIKEKIKEQKKESWLNISEIEEEISVDLSVFTKKENSVSKINQTT